MRTTLDLDEKLLEEVVKLTGEKSKSKAVKKALEGFLREARLNRLIDLQGRLDLDLNDWYEHRHTER